MGYMIWIWIINHLTSGMHIQVVLWWYVGVFVFSLNSLNSLDFRLGSPTIQESVARWGAPAVIVQVAVCFSMPFEGKTHPWPHTFSLMSLATLATQQIGLVAVAVKIQMATFLMANYQKSIKGRKWINVRWGVSCSTFLLWEKPGG